MPISAAADTAWILSRLLRKSIVSAIPIPLHFTVSRLRRHAQRRFSRVPPAVFNNIDTVFRQEGGPLEVDSICRNYLDFKSQVYLWRILPRHPGFRFSRSFPVSGIDHLLASSAAGRGTILVTAHLGYPHFIPRVLEQHGFTVRQLLAELDRPAVNVAREEWLKQAGTVKRYVYHKTRVLTDILGPQDMVASLDLRPLLSALTNNGVVMIAGDGLKSADFIRLPLLGRIYPFPTGFIKIARATGAAVIPVFATPRSKPAGIQVVIHPPLNITAAESIEASVQKFASVLDRQLRDTPHLWTRWRIPNWFDEALLRAEQIAF